jgi:AmmeMemoRadiSam system protein B/AmmeMemoRadiSam system protein A
MPTSEVHPAQVAGMFYPAEPGSLGALIDEARRRARADGGVAPKVVVAPHAGIVYSGAVAATAFGPWARRAEAPRRIVIVGPAHRVAFHGLAVHPAARWRTPLGEARVAAVTHAGLAKVSGVSVDPRPFSGEHSLEMHLVMLQAMLPAPFEIVPILVGDADPVHVAEALRVVWGGPETAIAVSSDLSHFLDRRAAETIDADTARRIETLDASALEGRRACGFLPIKGALEIAAERDMRASGLHLATSADVGADASRVVGYGAFAFEYSASARLQDADRELLLSACMAGLGEATQNGGKPPALRLNGRSPALSPWRATFVTLTESEQLRGCIGSPAPRRPLIDDAIANTAQAGFADPRFPALNENELAGLRLDVSILSHPRPIRAGSESELVSGLEPDRDGLILGAGERRALFLPSVWRQLPDGRAFVRHLIAKAGLETTSWPEGLKAMRFRVESFGAPWRRVDAEEIATAINEAAPALH